MPFWRSLHGRLTRDIGIDLGTANTVIYVRGKGIKLSEPSVVAYNRHTRSVIATGFSAKQMIGRAPLDVLVVRPLSDGVIGDIDSVEIMLKDFLNRAVRRSDLARPRMIIGIPACATQVEIMAVGNAARKAGAGDVKTYPEPFLAAIGAGLPVQEAAGNMVVDIGGGTTEVAVVALDGVVAHRSIRIAGDEMDQAIVQLLRKARNLSIGDRTAEEVKMQIGSAFVIGEERSMVVRGRHATTGLPHLCTIGSQEVRECLKGLVNAIIGAIRETLENTPPELSSDIMDRGMVLCGGGALLRGLDRRIAQEVGMPVIVADDPLTCVARGTGILLDTPEGLPRSLENPSIIPIAEGSVIS